MLSTNRLSNTLSRSKDGKVDMTPNCKKTLKIVSNTLVVFVLGLVFLLYGLQLFGLKPYSVLSGSMQSVYPTGSLLYVEKTDPELLEVGDVITFQMTGSAVCTHRIVELVEDENDSNRTLFRTKGDENETLDGGDPVKPEDVIGKPKFCIPLLGYLVVYISLPPGKYIAITVSVAIILIEVMISMILDEKSEKQTETNKE